MQVAFRALVGKGYQTLLSLLLDFCQWHPNEELFNALLDMLVDGKFDIKASPLIKVTFIMQTLIPEIYDLLFRFFGSWNSTFIIQFSCCWIDSLWLLELYNCDISLWLLELYNCDISSLLIYFFFFDWTQNEDVILLYLSVLQKVGDFFAFLHLPSRNFYFVWFWRNW